MIGIPSMNFEQIGVLIFVCINLVRAQSQFDIYNEVDLTLQPNTKGKNVVSAVSHLIDLSGIFENDERMIIRLAWVESRFGEANDTYNPSNQGGIWQVASRILDATQFTTIYPHLVQLHTKIRNTFSIDWMTVEISELDKPLYSGLAARLYLTTISTPIPSNIAEQAQYWKQNYNTNASLSPATYVNAVNLLEQNYTCLGKLDLIIVLDGSGSTFSYFPEIKNFMADLVGKFSLDHIRVGVIVYDYLETVVRLPLINSFSAAEIDHIIRNIPHPPNQDGSGERPDLGIRAAVQILKNADSREGAPQIIATFYDGAGNSALLTSAIVEAKTNNIVTYSVRVGNSSVWDLGPNKANFLTTSGNDSTQILAIPSNVDEASLNEFTYKLNDHVCRVSQNRLINVGDSLLQGETRYYNYDMSSVVTSFKLFTFVNQGAIEGFYSYTISNPSSALHDGSFGVASGDFDIIEIESIGEPRVYVAIRGEHPLNTYTTAVIVDKSD